MRQWRDDIRSTSARASSASTMRGVPSLFADLLVLGPALGDFDARALAVIPANTAESAYLKRDAPGWPVGGVRVPLELGALTYRSTHVLVRVAAGKLRRYECPVTASSAVRLGSTSALDRRST